MDIKRQLTPIKDTFIADKIIHQIYAAEKL
jgi:hypothetical protein